jgi:FkbM family methyltransferase
MKLSGIFKAEYFFRPEQLYKRIIGANQFPKNVGDSVVCKLPWNYQLKIKDDDIGKSILTLGLYDLVVSEAIARLSLKATDGSVLIDAGANIGHMSSIMDRFAPRQLPIHVFEPHPGINKELTANVELWKKPTRVKIHAKALADEIGTCDFYLPNSFSSNHGLGFINTSTNQHLVKDSKVLTQVEKTTLDSILNEEVFLMKIDTEGSELSVLKGAKNLINSKKIKNIIFEDHEQYPSPMMKFLEDNGFKLYSLQRSFFSLRLVSANQSRRETWEPNSFLATILNEEDINSIFQASGWRCLKNELD